MEVLDQSQGTNIFITGKQSPTWPRLELEIRCAGIVFSIPNSSHSRKVLHIPIPEIYTFEKQNHAHSRIAPDNSFPFPPIPILASTFCLIVGLPKTK